MKKLLKLLPAITQPLFFFVAISLLSIGFSWPIKSIFFLYSAFIVWALRDALQYRSENGVLEQPVETRKQKMWLAWLAIIAFGVILITRLIPFFRFGPAPLGYDTGFYIGSIKALIYPNSPTNASLYLLFTPFFAAGFPPTFLFHFLYVMFQVFLTGSLYFFLRSLPVPFRDRLATLGVILFSLSVIQFSAYWWAFAQQMLAMGFFLITLGLFLRGSFATIPFAVLTFLVHSSTGAVLFLSFVLYYVVYGAQLLFKRRYYYARAMQIGVIGLLFVPIIFLLKRSDIVNIFLDVWGPYGFLLKNVPPEWLSAYRGLFVLPVAFRLLVLGILPFSVFTVFYPQMWMRRKINKIFFYRHLLILYISLLVLILATFLPVIYQSRSSIILELLLLIFAAPSLLLFVEYCVSDRMGRILLGILTLFFVWNMGFHVWQQGSMISHAELNEIRTIVLPAMVDEPGEIMATDSLYAPWLWGFYGPGTVSPGYLGDTWSLETWNRFWGGDSDSERLRLLQSRGYPLYIYIGERQRHGLPFEKFIRTAPQLRQITPHLWKLIRVQPNGATP